MVHVTSCSPSESAFNPGFEDGQELDVLASPGEIKIVPAVVNGVTVSFTTAEAKALATGKLDSKSGEAALNKVRRVIGAE